MISTKGAHPYQVMEVWTRLQASLPCALTIRALESHPGVFLAGGAIRSAVWGHAVGDIDLVSLNDTAALADAAAAVRSILARHRLSWIDVDAVDQAITHTWHDSPPYASVDDAVAEWHDTATSISLTWAGDSLRLYAAYGLNDLLASVVRPTMNRVNGEWSALSRYTAKNWQRAGISYCHDSVERVDATAVFSPYAR